MSRYLRVASWLAPIMGALTLLTEYADQFPTPPFWGTLVSLPLLPGTLGYVLVTGDIHGWHPGPIGAGGRIAVVACFTTLWWTVVGARLTRRRREKSGNS
jgi:hypothetical protein